MTIETQIAACKKAAENPAAVLDEHIAAGKKVIGVGPYYIPEEMIHAAGAVPFGVWGRIGTAQQAKKYFPPFYCSICQMTLEMGMEGTLSKLSALVTTGLCDTLRAASQNYKAGMTVPQIYLSLPLHRQCDAGHKYALDSYLELKLKIEKAAGAIITDEALSASIKLYNEWRAEMRKFVTLAGSHAGDVSVADRLAVIQAGYYLTKEDHLAIVKEINAALAGMPESTDGKKKIVLSGIYEDIPAITEILDANGFAVVADDLAKESRAFAVQVAETGDPTVALAEAFCAIDNESILYDPKKNHCHHVVDLVKETGAQGVILLLAKFCDPEEFDAPITTKYCKAAGIPIVTVEIDQQTESYEQARTQLETFAELL